MKLRSRYGLVFGAALISLTFIGAISALGARSEESYKVHVVKWSTDAKLSRKLTPKELDVIRAARKKGDTKPVPAYKAIAGVHAGTNAEVPDIIETKHGSVDFKGGVNFFTRMGPNTTLKFISLNPPDLRPNKPADMIMSISKGQVQNRVGTVAQPSRMEFNGPNIVTGAKGTAYSVTVEGDKTTLVVAEGKVDIALAILPNDTVTVKPREKFIYDSASGAFPTAPVPVGPGDELLIQQLLSLPVDGLYGYTAGQDIRRADAENIVVMNVERIMHHIDGDSYSSYKPKWGAHNALYFSARDNFWTTDDAGAKKNIGNGLIFEALSGDGKTIIASKPNLGLWRMNWDGSGKKQITSRPLGAVQLSPDASRILAAQGWKKEAITRWDEAKRKEIPTGKSRWITSNHQYVSLSSSGGAEKVLGAKSDATTFAEAVWRLGSKRLFVQLYQPGQTVFIDADQNPAKVLATVPPEDEPQSWEVSPAAIWLVGRHSRGIEFVRTSDGQKFIHGRVTNAVPLMGEKFAETTDHKVFDISNESDPGRNFDDAEDSRYPIYSSGLSPNGEILAYTETGEQNSGPGERMAGHRMPSGGVQLAAFCDSLSITRNSVSAIRITDIYDISWINGRKVLYRPTDERAGKNPVLILTLAVKRKPSGEAGSTDTSGTTTAPDGDLSVSDGISTPKGFSKGVVFDVTPDGLAVTGAGVGPENNFLWKWTAAGGFVIGSKLPDGAGWSVGPNEPTARLAEWTKTHGWEARYPGKDIEKRKGFYLFATGISQDGSVVVGHYGSEVKDGQPGYTQGQTIDGHDLAVGVRCFVWTKAGGFKDLWNLVGSSKSVEPTTDLVELSVAVSNDGKAVVFLTDKLFVVRSKSAFGAQK